MQHSRLYAVMKQELEANNLQLSPYGVGQLENLVGNGLKRMTMANVVDHSGYIMQAERNLKSLIEYFNDYAKKMETHPELSDSHFDAAIRTCPTLWPYATSG
ncbi:MAG TPA: hypothetical protein VJ984_04590 [Xanthomonadales bacterium]|nr:hypothetical protein [Xanthomonadales bacterium]